MYLEIYTCKKKEKQSAMETIKAGAFFFFFDKYE